jgi:hypothetical protein
MCAQYTIYIMKNRIPRAGFLIFSVEGNHLVVSCHAEFIFPPFSRILRLGSFVSCCYSQIDRSNKAGASRKRQNNKLARSVSRSSVDNMLGRPHFLAFFPPHSIMLMRSTIKDHSDLGTLFSNRIRRPARFQLARKVISA